MAYRDATPARVRRLDYHPPPFLVDTIDLLFRLQPHATRVVARLGFRRNPAAGTYERSGALRLDGEAQRCIAVALDGVALTPDQYVLDAAGLTIVSPPDAGELTVESEHDPAANAALEGLYISSGTFCTQCEPEGFRRITYFPDRPDVLSRYRVRIEADATSYPVLLSNGNRVAGGPLAGGRHYAEWEDPFPKPCYLFALVAGNLETLEDTFVTASGRKVALAIWSTPANLLRCTHAMASLKRAMRWDEERFGLEYDLDNFMIFCADDFNMGAMENKGLNIFNSKLLLAHPETATDHDFQAIEAVIGHEYFHNWTGNRVTCRDWFQLSLKEGLTVFRDQEFSSDMGSRAVERVAAVEFLRSHQFPEDAGPMAHPVRPDEYIEINNFYTTTVYEKGAEVVRMLHVLLGEETFRRGMDLYFARHDGTAVTCDDFVGAMETASEEAGGPSLARFRRWYSQAGTPVVNAVGRYDAVRRIYHLVLGQETPSTPGQPHKEPFHIPIAVGLLDAQGRDLPLRLVDDPPAAVPSGTRVLGLVETSQSFEFIDVPEAPVPSLLRGFSAPVRLEFAYRDKELAHLAKHDSDPVNRWDAAQRIQSSALLELARGHAAGEPLVLPPQLIALARTLLSDHRSDPALLALALTPPELPYLASLTETIDVDGLVAARRFALRELGETLRQALVARIRDLAGGDEPYAPTSEQAGRRSLRNLCLRYLAATDDTAARTVCVAQYDAADNMTDCIAALAAINDSPSPEREALFARFESRWLDEPLVLDKWFVLQATAQRPDTLARVRLLLEHPRFNARNPNRVRSLLAAFALRNWAAFHARDGSGYTFIADQIVALDRINPHVSSLLAGAFNHWRRFAPARRGLQRSCLERLDGLSNLSPDLREIVTRNLA